jgi:hypothetical protein
MRNTIVILALLSIAGGCRSVKPIASDGRLLKFAVSVDPNTGAIANGVQKRRQEAVAAWMENDCVSMLGAAGCAAAKAGKATPPSDAYKLEIIITNYKWRYVGTQMTAAYKLTKNGKEILSSISSCGTSRNWRHCCRKINTEIIDAIRRRLSTN